MPVATPIPLATLLATLLALSGCAIPTDTSRRAYEAPTIAAARKLMPGLTAADVRMCAGFPSRSLVMENGEEIWTYERARPRGSVSLALPSVQMGGPLPAGLNGQVGMTSGGYCNTQMRFRGDRLTDIEFAGDNNSTTQINALCVPVVDGCVVYARHPDDRPARVDAAVSRVPAAQVAEEVTPGPPDPEPPQSQRRPEAALIPPRPAAPPAVTPGPDPVPEGGQVSLRTAATE